MLAGRPSAPLACALWTIGFTATASQVLVIRELLVIFHGNALFLGIIFGTWLLLEAVGSYAARGIAERTARPLPAFMALQICAGASPLASVLALRAFRYVLGIPVGELLGIQYVAVTSLLVLAPIALLDGALFPFGCRTLAEVCRREEVCARVYLYQSFGAFLAGLACGLQYVYTGNVPGHAGENTFCPRCKKAIIERTGFMIRGMHLKAGKCAYCGQPVPGIWA
jgi:hypothetical protein